MDSAVYICMFGGCDSAADPSEKSDFSEEPFPCLIPKILLCMMESYLGITLWKSFFFHAVLHAFLKLPIQGHLVCTVCRSLDRATNSLEQRRQQVSATAEIQTTAGYKPLQQKTVLVYMILILHATFSAVALTLDLMNVSTRTIFL